MRFILLATCVAVTSIGCGEASDDGGLEQMSPIRRDASRTVIPSSDAGLPIEMEDDVPFIDAGSPGPSTDDPIDDQAPDSPDVGDGADVEPGADPVTPPEEEPIPEDRASIFGLADDDVVAQFEFNGDAEDVSGNDRSGRLIGGDFAPSEFGQGLAISNENQGLDWSVYSVWLQHPYTVEMVFTPDAESATFSKLFGPDDDEEAGWYLYDEGFRTYPIEGVTQGAGEMPFGRRAYLAIVSTGATTIDVFINGVKVTDTPIESQIGASPDRAIFFRDDGPVSRYETINAVIDGLRISNTSRTADEIESIQSVLAD